MSRWKRAGKEQPGDYNVVDGKVAKWVQTVRWLKFWKPLKKKKEK